MTWLLVIISLAGLALLGGIMAVLKEVLDVLARIDAATNAIAARIDKLSAQVGAGGLTEAEEKQVSDALSAEADKLEALGKDPANPVPPAVTEPSA